MNTRQNSTELPQRKITEFWRRHHIRKLALFGSVLQGNARADSDMDVLVELETGCVPGLIRLAEMKLELSVLLGGREANLNTPLYLNRFFRDKMLTEAEPLYVAT